MKLTAALRGRRIRTADMSAKEWLKILYVGKDFYICKDDKGKEIVGVVTGEDIWELFYQHIPLKPLLPDYDEDVEEN